MRVRTSWFSKSANSTTADMETTTCTSKIHFLRTRLSSVSSLDTTRTQRHSRLWEQLHVTRGAASCDKYECNEYNNNPATKFFARTTLSFPSRTCDTCSLTSLQPLLKTFSAFQQVDALHNYPSVVEGVARKKSAPPRTSIKRWDLPVIPFCVVNITVYDSEDKPHL